MSSDFTKLTALVTTSSPKGTHRLLRSLARYCTGLKALVATEVEISGEGVTAVGVPASQDVNASRNALLARVRTPYVLLADDTIELIKQTQIGQMLASATSGEFDLVGGELQRCTKSWGLFTRREAASSLGTIEVRTTATGEQVAFQASELSGKTALPCDFAQSFYVARTDKLRALGGWTSASPFDEREEFFLRAKRFGLKVGVRPASLANWWTPDANLSGERHAAKVAALADLGVSQVADCDGNQLEVAAAPLSQAA